MSLQRDVQPPTLGMSPAMLLSCTAYEFGDPYLTPAPIWPGGTDHSLHPSSSSLDVSPRRRSLVTATIYPLHQHQQYPQHAKSVPGSRFSFGTPFPSATVRVTRQGITIYRQTDRVFLVDVRWADVTELKRHNPSEEPSMTEVAVVFARGIVVMDISSSHVAAGIWAALQHFHTLTDAVVAEELRRAAWGQTIPGGASDAVMSSALQSPTTATGGGPSLPEPEIVGRAKEILERFLGPNHNLNVTSPTRSLLPKQQEHAVRASSSHTTNHHQNELISPTDSPHKEHRRDDELRGGGTSTAASQARRSMSQLNARDRADELRREQDEQLQRIRRRESEMRHDIHHVASSSRATTPRSISTTSTALGGGMIGIRSDSPDVHGQDVRRRRAAAAARSGTPSAVAPAHASQGHPTTIVRKAPPPLAAAGPPQYNTRSSVSAMSAAVMEHRTTSISLSSAHGGYVPEYSQPPNSSSRLDALEYQAMRSVQVSRMEEREELTSDIAQLMDSLEDVERSYAAGASAQARRLSDVLRGSDADRKPIESHNDAKPLLTTAVAAAALPAVAAPQPAPHPTVQPVVEVPRAPPVAATTPAPVTAPVAPSPPSPLPSKAITSSPSQWLVKQDPQGKWYFVNPTTRVTTRKIEETDLTPAAVAAAQQLQQQQAPPPSAAVATAPPAAPPTPASIHTQAAPGWKTLVSDKGVPYYYHAPSKTTTWKIDDTYSILAAAGVEIDDVKPIVPSAKPNAPPIAPAASPAPAVPATSSAVSATAAGSAVTPTASTQNERPQGAPVDKGQPAAPAPSTTNSTEENVSSAAATSKPSAIQTEEDIRRENEARKQQAAAKVEEDKKHLRFGGMSMAEALRREQDALNGTTSKPKDPPPLVKATPPPPAASASPTPSTASAAPSSSSQGVHSPSAKDPGPNASAPSSTARVYGDWKELFDNKTNRVYYRNTRTQAASWTVPEEVRVLKARDGESPTATTAASAASLAATATSSSSQAASPSQGRAALRTIGAWTEKFNAALQRYYYVNSETKVSTYKIEETSFAGSPPN